jgi:hypothetical protein
MAAQRNDPDRLPIRAASKTTSFQRYDIMDTAVEGGDSFFAGA